MMSTSLAGASISLYPSLMRIMSSSSHAHPSVPAVRTPKIS